MKKPKSLFQLDRKSTRLNSNHLGISYAVFCLKKKKKTHKKIPNMTTPYIGFIVSNRNTQLDHSERCLYTPLVLSIASISECSCFFFFLKERGPPQFPPFSPPPPFPN